MLIETKEGKYRVYWRHTNFPKDKKVSTVTICSILKDGSIAPAVQGFSTCSREDDFCKDKGRKISLTRALREYPREFRTQIWQAYFKRGNNGN